MEGNGGFQRWRDTNTKTKHTDTHKQIKMKASKKTKQMENTKSKEI